LSEKPFLSNSETIKIDEPQPIVIHVKRLNWAKLHEEDAYILLQLAREFLKVAELNSQLKTRYFLKCVGKYYTIGGIAMNVTTRLWHAGLSALTSIGFSCFIQL
jgi:hypothetical protein